MWFDLDRDDPTLALADVRRLVGFTLFQFTEFDVDDLLYFFSGKRGYHVGVPLTHAPPPSDQFNAVCKVLAEGISAEVEVVIDSAIFDKVRLLRAPNSKHPTSGLHKVRLTHDELMGLSGDRIAELATTPIPFAVPTVGAVPPQLVERWRGAETVVRERAAARVARPAATAGWLNRATMDYIKHGTGEGKSRHISLFSAAGNLREFGANEKLITALLEEQGLDDGLPPSEVARQIRCGIDHADQQAGGGAA